MFSLMTLNIPQWLIILIGFHLIIFSKADTRFFRNRIIKNVFLVTLEWLGCFLTFFPIFVNPVSIPSSDLLLFHNSIVCSMIRQISQYPPIILQIFCLVGHPVIFCTQNLWSWSPNLTQCQNYLEISELCLREFRNGQKCHWFLAEIREGNFE